MRVLILGGTQFVGRHLAQTADAAGHDVTLFNRGSRREVLPHLPRVLGDRDGGLAGLRDSAFDAVIDVNGYLPRLVRDAAELLEARVDRYLFVSTISVYDGLTAPHADEGAPVGVLEDPSTESIEGGTYGPLKAACETVVADVFGARGTVVRPGLVVGRFDPTDRFTYWVRRLWRGGDVLAPGAPAGPLQWVDVRDLADFMLHLVEREVGGVFNAVRPADSVTTGELLTAAGQAALREHTLRAGTLPEGDRREGTSRVEEDDDGAAVPGEYTLTWVDEEFLAANGVRPWAELPAWLPSSENDLIRMSSARAVAAGLETRPLIDTVADVLAWDLDRGAPPLKAGLSSEREGELLAQWRNGPAHRSA